jgi:hypothetical protein
LILSDTLQVYAVDYAPPVCTNFTPQLHEVNLRNGCPQLTDQAKRKILGENLLRLHGMDVEETKARLGKRQAH